MNWNSIARSACAFIVYMAVMIAYLAGLTPISFALCLAAVLSLGLLVHSKDVVNTTKTDFGRTSESVMPSLSESMAELHSLQNEINELQAQFAVNTTAQRHPRDGFAG